MPHAINKKKYKEKSNEMTKGHFPSPENTTQAAQSYSKWLNKFHGFRIFILNDTKPFLKCTIIVLVIIFLVSEIYLIWEMCLLKTFNKQTNLNLHRNCLKNTVIEETNHICYKYSYHCRILWACVEWLRKQDGDNCLTILSRTNGIFF